MISSRNQEVASNDIQNRMKSTPEYNKVVELLNDKDYGRIIFYGELLKKVSPTRLEPRRKHIHWILFDMYDVEDNRFMPYSYVYQTAYHFKIPVVRLVDEFIPSSLDDLQSHIDEALKWCKRHRREGVVGKTYYVKEQVFFKEKVDLPKRKKLRKDSVQVLLPEMPEEKIIRAMQHAFDVVGEENWHDKAKAMPIVARYVSTEAREHRYRPPSNIYRYYVDTPIEVLKLGSHKS